MESSLSRSSLLGSCLSTDMFTDMFMETPVASLGEGAEDHSPVEGYRRNQRLVIPGTGAARLLHRQKALLVVRLQAYGRVSCSRGSGSGRAGEVRCAALSEPVWSTTFSGTDGMGTRDTRGAGADG